VLVTGVAFSQVIVAVHVMAVVVTFGVAFSYPLVGAVGSRMDPRALPWYHRMQQLISRRLVSPGLLVVLLAGIYLASDLHKWGQFFVQWGVAVVIVLGGLDGGFMVRQYGKLAEIAERDVATAGAGEVQLSPDYFATIRRVAIVGGVMNVLVLVTIYIMVVNS
jgi:hypothetical protein